MNGTDAIVLCDRIVPQSARIEYGQAVISYVERALDKPMSTSPSITVSKYLRINDGVLIEIPANEYAVGNFILGIDGDATTSHLVGSNGKALYFFTKDLTDISECKK